MSMPAQHTLQDDAAALQTPKPSQRWLAVGGILGALASISCCIVPLALFSVGITGAWMSNLTALAPYQPYFLAFTLVCLGVGFYKVYRKPQIACVEGSYCAKPVSNYVVKSALWVAVVLVIAALIYPWVAPWLLEL